MKRFVPFDIRHPEARRPQAVAPLYGRQSRQEGRRPRSRPSTWFYAILLEAFVLASMAMGGLKYLQATA